MHIDILSIVGKTIRDICYLGPIPTGIPFLEEKDVSWESIKLDFGHSFCNVLVKNGDLLVSDNYKDILELESISPNEATSPTRSWWAVGHFEEAKPFIGCRIKEAVINPPVIKSKQQFTIRFSNSARITIEQHSPIGININSQDVVVNRLKISYVGNPSKY